MQVLSAFAPLLLARMQYLWLTWKRTQHTLYIYIYICMYVCTNIHTYNDAETEHHFPQHFINELIYAYLNIFPAAHPLTSS